MVRLKAKRGTSLSVGRVLNDQPSVGEFVPGFTNKRHLFGAIIEPSIRLV